MADERNKILYDTIKNNAVFKAITGGTTSDPRLYKFKTPLKLEISDSKPAYAIYRRMGTTKLPGYAKIDIGQLNDRAYSLEVFGKIPEDVDEICSELEENVFYEASFFTANLKIGYTWAVQGSINFDEGRQLHLETMTIYFTKILKLIST